MEVVLVEYLNPQRYSGISSLFLAPFLRRHGFSTEVLRVDERNRAEMLEAIVARAPGLVGLSIDHMNAGDAARFARDVRARIKTFLIAGGPQATLYGEQVLKEFPWLDCVCAGEGEHTLLEVAQRLARGAPARDVAGTLVLDGDRVVRNAPRPLIEDLDALPVPDVDPKIHAAYPLVTSRGCPYDCVFCLVKRLFDGHRWRARSAEVVVDELRAAKERGFEAVLIEDDAFNIDLTRAKKIFEGVIRQDLRLEYSFGNGVRADRLDEELVSLMRRAGVIRVPLGVENLDPQTAAATRKALTREQVRGAVALLKKHGFCAEAFMIIGLPDTSWASTMRSVQAVREVGFDVARWYVAIPYPGTELHAWACAHGTLLDVTDWGRGNWSCAPPLQFETRDFPRDQRLAAYYTANALTGNFYPLLGALSGGEGRVQRLGVLASAWLSGLRRVVRHAPRQVPGFVSWTLHSAWDPSARTFNEPWSDRRRWHSIIVRGRDPGPSFRR